MKATPPKISVILPVYNGQIYLRAAIQSVLSQSFRDFELIVVNDGSSDGSRELLESFGDPRIRLFHQTNRGLAATLNIAIAQARGKYIARQDQDDICLSSRLQKQVEFLDAHADVGMVGTAAEIWVEDTPTKRLLSHPIDDAKIRFELLFDNRFVHSSVMFRRAVIQDIGGYCEDKLRQPPEDFELWSRMMRKYRLANLPEALTVYREVQGSMSRTGVSPFLGSLIRISAENIAWATRREPETPEVNAMAHLYHRDYRGLLPSVRWSDIHRLLMDAAARIAQESAVAPSALDHLVRSYSRKLRYRYCDWRLGGFPGVLVDSSIGTYMKQLGKRIL